MGIGTLVRYLIGGREAILTIAARRQSLWIGLLFVLSAGFAREYDGEDLLHEPWHLFLPLAASLASSFVLFTLAYGAAVMKGVPWRDFFTNYAAFLGLFWMTAPLAWLYAMPYERFLTPADAMRLNLISLAVVSAWRVALMVRVLTVILKYSPAEAVFLVFLFADAVALTLLTTLPVPLIDVMGGIRLSEPNRILRNVACGVCQLGCLSLPLWFLGALLLLIGSRPSWQVPAPAANGGGLRWLAVGSVLIWVFILPWTQPEQLPRRSVEKAVAEKRFTDAVAEMKARRRSDFPPAWDPPPRQLAIHDPDDDFVQMLEEIARTDFAGAENWVREVYLDKTVELLAWTGSRSTRATDRLAAALKRIPDGESVIARLEALGDRYSAETLTNAWPNDEKKEDK